MNNPLEIEDLSIRDRITGRFILENFNFAIERGMVFACIGESGSGKTTFALSLFNLLKKNLEITYGRYSIFGNDYSSISSSGWTGIRGKRIVLIPQNPVLGFHPYMKIGSQISEYLSVKLEENVSGAQMKGILESVGIPNPEDKLKSFPFQISGGERQRILIAMALVARPEIIVADEPTASLDPGNEESVLRLLFSAAREKGSAVILITHNLKIVESVSDKVTILKKGKSIEEFTVPDGVLPELKSDYSRELFGLRTFYNSERNKVYTG